MAKKRKVALSDYQKAYLKMCEEDYFFFFDFCFFSISLNFSFNNCILRFRFWFLLDWTGVDGTGLD